MPDADNGAYLRRPWPYAENYRRVLNQGHQNHAPAVGSPTLIWHMSISPSHPFGDKWRNAKSPEAPGEVPFDEAAERFEAYDADNTIFFKEISDFAVHLQRLGRIGDAKELVLTRVQLPNAHSFLACEPQALAFTLWWSDDAKDERPNKRPTNPPATDLRVRVHVQTHRDHATFSFYVDVAKSYGKTQVDDAQKILTAETGVRRSKILQHIQAVRRVSGEQIRQGYVELNRIPERAVSTADAQALHEGANYLYQEIWREFAKAFQFDQIKEVYGERFADFRGLVMSIRGLDGTQGEQERAATRAAVRQKNAPLLAPEVKDYTDRAPPQDVPLYDSGTIGFGPLAKFDENSNEANTVLKSLWPFMRRIAPLADYRDWVACGIIGGRALYITPLGSAPSVEAANEESPDRDTEVSSRNLPPIAEIASTIPRPIRYLIVTKGEPPREQLGRFVERINALGTMRLFALRNMASIQNASIHIEVLARMLDGTLQSWEFDRNNVDAAYRNAREQALRKIRGGKRSPAKKFRFPLLRLVGLGRDDDEEKGTGAWRAYKRELKENIHPLVQRVEDRHILELSGLVRETEGRLIQIAGGLDSVGEGGSGRMLYVIRRANYFANEFTRMYPTLKIVDVDGWISYNNFVDRGMRPAFALIFATGERLRFIRERIQIVTETIQTAALIVETAATRENTRTLKKIVSSIWWLRLGALGVFGIAAKITEPWWSQLSDAFIPFLWAVIGFVSATFNAHS